MLSCVHALRFLWHCELLRNASCEVCEIRSSEIRFPAQSKLEERGRMERSIDTRLCK